MPSLTLKAFAAGTMLLMACAAAIADPRERGETFQLGPSANGGTLDLFDGKADADFNFAAKRPSNVVPKPVTVDAKGPVVTILEVFRTTSGDDAWYLVDVKGTGTGFVRAAALAAFPVAATLPRRKGLNWWDKVSPRDLAAQRKAALTQETKVATKEYQAAQDKKIADASGPHRATLQLLGKVCSLGMGVKLTPLRETASATGAIKFFLRDGTLVTLREDTDPVWRLVDSHINDGSVMQGYVAKEAIGACFTNEGPLIVTDVPNQVLP